MTVIWKVSNALYRNDDKKRKFQNKLISGLKKNMTMSTEKKAYLVIFWYVTFSNTICQVMNKIF